MTTFTNIGVTLAAACALSLGASALGDTITLKTAVRLPLGATGVKLADIAELDGPDATRFGDAIVRKIDSDAVIEIPIRDVRATLDESGVNWAKINLSGRKVIVRPGRSADAAAPMAMTPVSLAKDEASRKPAANPKDERIAATIIDSPTLRGMIANLIVSNLHANADDVRLAFDHNDAALLDTPTQTTRFEIDPLGDFSSDRLDFTIRTWSGDAIKKSQALTVIPKIRTKASKLRTNVNKDQVINEADLDVSEQWLSPGVAAQAGNRVIAVGRVAGKNLKAGDLLREQHIRRESLVKRGDQVMVRCLVGGVAISLQAEARADGGQGDVIEFRKTGERESFLATVTGRGEAVVDLSTK